ncbi:uncharacterized protein V1510DRAFT_116907 [Dipodascopsis tothii]|uniref:uncharacterized protein n=1 Tax=Dipodascopsis tothii TaxID=44089 RepID=UPI0034CEF5DD
MTKQLGERQLFLDIVGHVPVEILQLIVSYCSAQDVLVWRQVCRRWRARLESDVVCGYLLRRDFADERPSLRPQDRAVPAVEALRLCAFRDAAVRQSGRLGVRSELKEVRPTLAAYFGGHLVVAGYTLGSQLTMTMLYELYSDRKWRLQQSRESWYELTVSEDVCAGVTSLGKCKAWTIRDPSTFQQRQLLSSNTRMLTSAGRLVGVVMADSSLVVWDTAEDDEIETDAITARARATDHTIYQLSINARKGYLVVLTSQSVQGDVQSAVLVYTLDQDLVFSTPMAFFANTRLYRPIRGNSVVVTCSGIRTLTRLDLDNFRTETFGGFLANGDSFVGVPFRNSVFMLEGSYLSRLTMASQATGTDGAYADRDGETKWIYHSIFKSLDHSSVIYDLLGDGHYICVRMTSGIVILSFNLYDYEAMHNSAPV